MSILDIPIIGFDAEWDQPFTDDPEDHNRVLSYQFCVLTQKGQTSGIIYTKSGDKKHRLTFDELIGRALEQSRKQKVVPYQWPTEVIAVAHFARADIAAFKNFSEFAQNFDALRGTLITRTRPYKAKYRDRSHNTRKIDVTLSDTLLLSPGKSSLRAIGEVHGFEKIKLPDGAIENMGDLLANDPDLFKRYAIRDAEIAAAHARSIFELAEETFRMERPPLTLSQLGVEHLRSVWNAKNWSLNELLGKEQHPKTDWSGKKPITRKQDSWIPLIHQHEQFAISCYHGGRNEAYRFGYTDIGVWYDYDLVSAYTTAMAAIRTPDWGALHHSTNLDDFTADTLGICRVDFKFPDGTRFPSLPVRDKDDRGLIFPLSGTALVASPEIQAARAQGAELKILDGLIVPWKGEENPFLEFVKSVKANRAANPKGSVAELTWKEIGNSLYGKMAQGLRAKNVFDSKTGYNKRLPPSEVTQPFLAAYVTSIVRAVLGEIISSVPSDKEVVSATTDGFITNVAPDGLMDLVSGPLATFFADCRERIDGKRNILEEKHCCVGHILCWRTRGQAALPWSAEADGAALLAKAGIKAPKEIRDGAALASEVPWSEYNEVTDEFEFDDLEPYADAIRRLEVDYIHRLFMSRDPNTRLTFEQFPSTRDMILNDMDLLTLRREKRLNMEFDWKRNLIPDISQKVPGGMFAPSAPNVKSEHLSFTSEPWDTIEDFSQTRDAFDTWSKGRNCIKEQKDWERWQEAKTIADLRNQGYDIDRRGLAWTAVMQLRAAHAHKEWGLGNQTNKEFAERMTGLGYKTSVQDLKNAKGRKEPDRSLLLQLIKQSDRAKDLVEQMQIPT